MTRAGIARVSRGLERDSVGSQSFASEQAKGDASTALDVVRWKQRLGIGVALILSLIGYAIAIPATAHAAEEKCGYAKTSVDLEARGPGGRLGTFSVNVRFCYDGEQVTKVDTPDVKDSLTDFGRSGGWSYDNDSEHVSDLVPITAVVWSGMGPPSAGEEREIKGFSLSASGKFVKCVSGPIEIGCLQERQPEVGLDLRGENGTFVATGNVPAP